MQFNEKLCINESDAESDYEGVSQSNNKSEPSQNFSKIENEAIKKMWSLIKVQDSVKLGQDQYSLTFYGFYLEDDEEELSEHFKSGEVKNMLS